jgi:uncharacterized protein with von Willebrand factor type A (vWA) domain
MTKTKTPPSKPTYTSEEILANAKFRLWNLCPPLCRPYDIYVVEGNAPFAGYATEKRICISDSVLKKEVPVNSRLFVLAHEIMHWLLDHPKRMKNIINRLRNSSVPEVVVAEICQLCADAIVNEFNKELCKINADNDTKKRFRVIYFKDIQDLVDQLCKSLSRNSPNVSKMSYEEMVYTIVDLLEDMYNKDSSSSQTSMSMKSQSKAGTDQPNSNQASGSDSSDGSDSDDKASGDDGKGSDKSGKGSDSRDKNSSGSRNKSDIEEFIDKIKDLYEKSGHMNAEDLIKEIMKDSGSGNDSGDDVSGNSNVVDSLKRAWLQDIIDKLVKKDNNQGIGTETLGAIIDVREQTIEDIYIKIMDFIQGVNTGRVSEGIDVNLEDNYFRQRQYQFGDIIEPSIDIINPSVLIVIDTSGSMCGCSQSRLSKAIGAVIQMAQYLDIDSIIEYDAQVCNYRKITDVVNIRDYLKQVRGGGGTDMGGAILSAVEVITKNNDRHVSAIVVVTDCETPWPEEKPKIPVCVVNVGDMDEPEGFPEWAYHIRVR